MLSAKRVPGGGVVAGPHGGVALDARVRRAGDHIGTLVGPQAQKAFISGASHAEGEDVAVSGVGGVGAIIEGDDVHLRIAGLVDEVGGFIHVGPDTSDAMIGVGVEETAPPARGGGKSIVDIDGVAGPYFADPQVAALALEEVISSETLVKDVVRLILRS